MAASHCLFKDWIVAIAILLEETVCWNLSGGSRGGDLWCQVLLLQGRASRREAGSSLLLLTTIGCACSRGAVTEDTFSGRQWWSGGALLADCSTGWCGRLSGGHSPLLFLMLKRFVLGWSSLKKNGEKIKLKICWPLLLVALFGMNFLMEFCRSFWSLYPADDVSGPVGLQCGIGGSAAPGWVVRGWGAGMKAVVVSETFCRQQCCYNTAIISYFIIQI